MGPLVDRSPGIPRHLRPGDLPRAAIAAGRGQALPRHRRAVLHRRGHRLCARSARSPFAYSNDEDWRDFDARSCSGGGGVAQESAGRAAPRFRASSALGRIGRDPLKHTRRVRAVARQCCFSSAFSASELGVLLLELVRDGAVGILQRIAVLRADQVVAMTLTPIAAKISAIIAEDGKTRVHGCFPSAKVCASATSSSKR